jgi:hypothetical protein
MCRFNFFIDIPFKESQSLSNSRSPGTAGLYWHSGVSDTGVLAKAASMSLLSFCAFETS